MDLTWIVDVWVSENVGHRHYVVERSDRGGFHNLSKEAIVSTLFLRLKFKVAVILWAHTLWMKLSEIYLLETT